MHRERRGRGAELILFNTVINHTFVLMIDLSQVCIKNKRAVAWVDRHHCDEQVCGQGIGEKGKWGSSCTKERGETGDWAVVRTRLM